MNKTVTINISGIIFHIEEDAYEKLSKYLSTIKGYFSRTDGGSEIMSDIEARIAEMLQARTSAVKQVVLMADVDAVIEAMGRPEEFAGEGEHTASSASQNDSQGFSSAATAEPVKRRLFRDPEHKAVGGVCSGIAAYFDIDIVWIRLATFLLIFFGGLSLWVYIILWIVIPEARTTADKLSMHGERVDINNISKAVKEEAEQLKNRVNNYSRGRVERTGDVVRDIFRGIGRVLSVIFGVLLVLLSIALFFVLIGTFFGLTVIDNTSAREYISGVFHESGQQTLLIIGSVLVIGIPAIMLMYKGIKLLFRIYYHNRWLNLGAGLLWFTGLLLCSYVGMDIASEFSESEHVRIPFELQQPTGNTLWLKVNGADKMDDYNEYRRSRHGRIHTHRHPDWLTTEKDGRKLFIGFPNLNIITSESDNFELYMIKSSKGSNRKDALERARNISYTLGQEDSVITFNNYFSYATTDKLRDQDVELILKVPKNKVLYLDKSLANFIYDVENVTNTFDGDMVGRRWTMTRNGLACLDCEGIDTEGTGTELPAPPAPPSAPGLNVDTKDAKINIGKEGIKIKSKDANVNVDKNGIHIDTKDKKENER